MGKVAENFVKGECSEKNHTNINSNYLCMAKVNQVEVKGSQTNQFCILSDLCRDYMS